MSEDVEMFLQGFDIFLFGTTAEKSSVNIRAINPDFCLCPRAIGEQKNHNIHSRVAFQQSSLLPQSPLWWTLSFLLFLLTKNGHHCFVRPLNKPWKRATTCTAKDSNIWKYLWLINTITKQSPTSPCIMLWECSKYRSAENPHHQKIFSVSITRSSKHAGGAALQWMCKDWISATSIWMCGDGAGRCTDKKKNNNKWLIWI